MNDKTLLFQWKNIEGLGFCVKNKCSHSMLLNQLLTAGRQGQHLLAFLKILFTWDTATAQASLYNYS